MKESFLSGNNSLPPLSIFSPECEREGRKEKEEEEEEIETASEG